MGIERKGYTILGNTLIIKANLRMSVICLTCWSENSLGFINALIGFCHHLVKIIYSCNHKCFKFWLNNKAASEAGLGLQKTAVNVQKFFMLTVWHCIYILWNLFPRNTYQLWKELCKISALCCSSVIFSTQRINENGFISIKLYQH